MRSRSWTIVTVCLACCLFAGRGRATGLLPVAYQMPLLLKLVTYELNLMNKSDPVIRFAVLFVPERPESKKCFEEVQDMLGGRNRTEIRGRRVDLIPLPIRESEALALPPGLTGVDVIYVTPGNESRVGAIARWTREQDALSVTAVEECVENGLSVGLISKGAGGAITLNLPASLEEGREWNVNVLQIARVIRGGDSSGTGGR